MGKRKERSELEYLRAANKHIEKQNRQLKYQLARADKAVLNMHNSLDPEPQVTQSKPEMPKCPDCKSNISVIDFGVKLVSSCKSCGYRKTEKKDQE